MGIVETSTVRDVAGVDPHAIARGRNNARLLFVFAKTTLDIRQSDARQDGYAIPLTQPEVSRLVPELAKRLKGKLHVLLLGLLNQEHIDVTSRQKLFDSRPASIH